MKSLIYILLVFLFSCGEDICKDSDFYTKQGICVLLNGNGFAKQDIEMVIEISENLVSKRKNIKINGLESEYENTSISFVNYNLENGASGTTDYEITPFYKNYFIKIGVADCYPGMELYVFSHEVLHLFIYTYHGDHNHNFEDFFFGEEFSWERNKKSIEYEIYQILDEKFPSEWSFPN